MSVVPQEKKITEDQIVSLSNKFGIEVPMVKSLSEVEGSGIGFSDYTGRMLIQFEPSWMNRFLSKESIPKFGTWLNNGIEDQIKEWDAFNSAYKSNMNAAMKSTSVGMMQVMCLHYDSLGFDKVIDMWNFASVNEVNQLELGLRFCKNNASLYAALKARNFHLIAYYYNGAGYKELASKNRSIPYDIRLRNAFSKFALPTEFHRTTTTVNIRQGAGLVFDKAGEPLRVNTAVSILSEHNGWTHVAVIASGMTGWVSSQYIK